MSDSAFRTHDGRTLEQAASDLVQREVLCCMSSMVATLARGFAGDGSGSDLQNLAEQAYDLAAPVLDYEEAAREAGWRQEDGHWYHDTDRRIHTHVVGCSNAAEACHESDVEPHEREVFEHWAVSQWFGDALQAAGERVDDEFAGLVVWARTTTGQAIHADAVVERIAREMNAPVSDTAK